MGPHSRQLLQTLTKTPLDNSSFPFATMQVGCMLKVDMYTEVTRRKLKSGTWSDIKEYLWVSKPHQRETGVLRAVLHHSTAL